MESADLVLEGGGVKGFGTVGAVLRLMDAGYTFPRAAGTSVGAMAAAFVATGMGGRLPEPLETAADSFLI